MVLIATRLPAVDKLIEKVAESGNLGVATLGNFVSELIGRLATSLLKCEIILNVGKLPIAHDVVKKNGRRYLLNIRY